MSGFNGAGVFVRVHNWTDDANAAINIRADRMDEEDDAIATGLSNCITKDGQTTTTAVIPFSAGISVSGGGTVANLDSGTYTPTGTGLTNVTSVTPGKAQWMRVGSIVTVSGTFSCTPTAATATSFTLSLPVASALSATTDLAGAGGNDNDNVVLFVVGKTSNGTAQISYFATTTNARVFSYTYTYEVK